MKKMNTWMVAAAVLAASALTATAAVSIAPQAGPVAGDASGTPLSAESLIVFIADVEGDGFGDWANEALGTEGFTLDDDDVLLGIGTSGPTPGFVVNTYLWSDVTADSPEVGAEFAMLWFETPFVEGMDSVEKGVNYGVYETGASIQGNEQGKFFAWLGTTYGGNLADSTFNASYTTVPEPASMLILALGGSVAVLRRRRNG